MCSTTFHVFRRTISHGYFKDAVGIALLPDGQNLLIAFPLSIVIHRVLLHELLKSETIWDESVEIVSIFFLCKFLVAKHVFLFFPRSKIEERQDVGIVYPFIMRYIRTTDSQTWFSVSPKPNK